MAFPLKFDIPCENFGINVSVYAEVSFDISTSIYSIREIRIRHHRNVMPDLTIRKKGEEWIDLDSLKSTRFSRAIGAAIDRLPNFAKIP